MFNKEELREYLGKKVRLILNSSYILTGEIESVGDTKLRFIGKFGEYSLVDFSEIKTIMEIGNG